MMCLREKKRSDSNAFAMTQGDVRRTLILFALPLMTGNLLQQIYSFVDTAVVGKGISYQALAAVGAAFPIVQLFLGIGSGLSNGLSIVIARKFGAGNERQTRKAVVNGFYLGVLATILITAGGLLFLRPLFTLIHTPPEVIASALVYSRICIAGAAAAVCYNIQSGILRALGNSRAPLLFLMLSSLLNVLLDILLVIHLHGGVGSAAIATVFSQAASCLFCFGYIHRNMAFLLPRSDEWKPDFILLKEHLRVSMPMAFFDCILYVSFLLLQAPLNRLGSISMAAYTAASKIDSLVMRILGAFGTAISTFVAQNSGNSSFERIREGTRACTKITVSISLGATLLVFLFAQNLISLFVSANETAIIAAGIQYLRTTSLFYIILGVNFTIRFALIGLGKSSIPFWVAIMEVVVRSTSTRFLVQRLGFAGITLPNPFCWLTSTLFIAALYPGMFRQAAREYDISVSMQTQSK